MFYPIGGCGTQPLVSISDVTLRNIKQTGSWLPPGVIRCNETAPCKNFVFDNVQASGWWSILGLNYISENIEGIVTDSKPDPGFRNSQDMTKKSLFSDWSSHVADELMKSVREFYSGIYSNKSEKGHGKKKRPDRKHQGHAHGHRE